MNAVAPRIHILLASQSHVGVVIRRGPSKSVCTILWDRDTDQFTLGQWLKGRIFERRSDLSPDGMHMIYFAMNGRWDSPAAGAWTAVSRAPYLKAVHLHPKGDCWYGGGLFLNSREYWLNGGLGRQTVDSKRVRVDPQYQPSPSYGGECPGVYYRRLQRDGWKYVSRSEVRSSSVDIFEKPIAHGWLLRKLARSGLNHPEGKGVYFDEHELLHPTSKSHLNFSNWEWADFDRKRLVYAADGKLFAARLDDAGPTTPRQLHDFTNMTFEAIHAPY